MAVPALSAALLLRRLAESPQSGVSIEMDSDGSTVELLSPRLRFHHSYVAGALRTRAAQTTQSVLKACNNRQRKIGSVLDLTAGWGADSLAIAHHGQQVTMLEQHPLIYAINAYSLERLALDPESPDLAARLNIENTDAKQYLASLQKDHAFDCIYLDPMFPAHKSSAKPAKEMQILQALTGNQDIEECFELALARARRRVVVKSPARIRSFPHLQPDISYRDKTIRFDVYLTT